jgi:hypothetical protein
LYPKIKQFLTKIPSDNVNLLVIMGDSRSHGENEREAKLIGEKVIIDHDGSIAHELKVRFYPTVMLLNEYGHIIKKNQEAMDWMVEMESSTTDR